MTNEEKELDAWIDRHVMEWDYAGPSLSYSTDPAASMALWKKCMSTLLGVSDLVISPSDDGFLIECDFDEHPGISAFGKTFELAVALFAKALFSKEEAK